MPNNSEDAERTFPYNPPWKDQWEALRLLVTSKRNNRPHIPTFAREWFRYLADVGIVHGAETGPSAFSNVRLAKLRDQTLWIRFGTVRNEVKGYMDIEIIDAPSTDEAVLAGMTVGTTKLVDIEQLRRVLQVLKTPFENSVYYQGRKAFRNILDDLKEKDVITAEGSVKNPADPDYELLKYFDEITAILEYVVALLRYHKPGFDDLTRQEQLDLIEKTCGYINEFLESSRKLQAFLSYGAPKRKLTPPSIQPQQDIDAAVLHDVDDLNYREIGQHMGVPLPPDFSIKGEHQTVRKMVDRGRRILEEAFGEEGWREQAKAMKDEKARFWSLGVEERIKEGITEMVALDFNIPLGEARWWVVDSGLSFEEIYQELKRRSTESEY